MKKIIAEIGVLNGGVMHSMLYCHDANGQLDKAVTHTLLEFVTLSEPSHKDLEALLQSHESGKYVPKHSEWADWGVNDIELWLRPPMAQPGHVCISRDYIEEYSTEFGQPQQFTYEQFRAALKHWREFQALIAREGKERLVGRRYEAVFPE